MLNVSEGAVESGGFERDDEFCIIPRVYSAFMRTISKAFSDSEQSVRNVVIPVWV
ncbi:MAG: hypothetical protein ACI4JE_05885 [Ruminococcus sp.]